MSQAAWAALAPIVDLDSAIVDCKQVVERRFDVVASIQSNPAVLKEEGVLEVGAVADEDRTEEE